MTTAHCVARWLRGLWLALWTVFVSTVTACFPAPLTCAEIAATGQTADHCALDAADSAHSTDTGGVDATGLDVADSETADSLASDAASDTDAEDTSEVVDAPDTTTAEVASETTGTDSTATDVDDADTSTDSSGEVIETNVCGGVGAVGPGQPGEPCGPCLDGDWVCDPDDEAQRTTRCEGARAVDACGGCGLAHPLGDACGDCGTWACDAAGATDVVCSEPVGGCPIILTCDDVDCDLVSRECIESNGVDDAACAGCIATHQLVGGACVPRLFAPTGVAATSDRSADIEITWSAAANATGYRVYRCDTADCTVDASWNELTTDPIAGSPFVDSTAVAPAAPSAPGNVAASQVLTDRVDVAWSAVSAPLAPKYRYRVTTIGAAGESAPSTEVQGARAERPVTGYEVQVDDGVWTVVPGGLVTGWSDPGAAQATLSAGTASASLGTYPDFVRLSLSGASSTTGAARSYRVRAVTAYGPAASSSSVSGWRVAGALDYQWERSADASATGFAAIAGATSTTYDDTGAPADGSSRWYRVVVGAAGATDVVTAPVAGARQGPPGVPGSVRASRDLTDRVLVEWQAVSGAIGYHVYRDGTKLTTGTGVTSTSYGDFDAPAPTSSWAAPTGVTATTNSTSAVTVQWTAPAQPVGAGVAYRVSAVNAAGEGTLSASANGNRVALALVGYDVETTPTGGNTTWISTGSTGTSWVHATAPAGTITPGTITVTQGDHMAHVRLVSAGASVASGVNVTYRVRGVLAGGTSYTAVSGSATGRRTVGALTRQWQRSASTTAADFTNLTGATSSTNNDVTAPADGAKRWYQLVLGATGATSVTVGPAEGWRLAFVAVVGGSSHTCALTSHGYVWCWGGNSHGQLGRGTTSSFESSPGRVGGMPVVAEVDAGGNHTCARTAVGEVWCWGSNESGQLGDGTQISRSTPVSVEALAGAVIDLSGGAGHTCVVLLSGKAQCWGENLQTGQLGNNTTVNSATPVTVLASTSIELTGLLTVSAGGRFTCARRGTDVKCWGSDEYGELANTTVEYSSPIAVTASGVAATSSLVAGNAHTCTLQLGAVICWGDNGSGQLGSGVSPGAAEISAGFDSTCARWPSGDVKCWGRDLSGELGNGEPRLSTPTPVVVTGVTASTGIGSGYYHHCAVVGGGIKCWGANQSRQLGDGTAETRSEPVNVVMP